MKNIIITLSAVALCLQAQAQIGTLSTTDGTTYTGITLQRAEPDGLYIEYAIPGGGIGMSKVKFDRLSSAQQKRYGYNENEARDYEASVAEANNNAAQELIHRYEVARDSKNQREAENQRVYASRMAEITRANADLAAAFYNTKKADPQGNRSVEIWTQFSTARATTQTSFGPPAPDLFPTRSYSTKSH